MGYALISSRESALSDRLETLKERLETLNSLTSDKDNGGKLFSGIDAGFSSGLNQLTENADTYSNTVEGATINALGGNDKITNIASKVSISGGAGNDFITTKGTRSTKNETHQVTEIVTVKEPIYENQAYTTTETTYEEVWDWVQEPYTYYTSRPVKRYTGGGHYITSYESVTETRYRSAYKKIGTKPVTKTVTKYKQVQVGTKDVQKTITKEVTTPVTTESVASKVSISGGTGNDTISIGSATSNNFISYKNGDGNDKIYNLGSTDSLSISGNSYTTQVSGNDILVKVGSGTITLVNAKGTNPNIIGESTPSTLMITNSTKSSVSLSSSYANADASKRTEAIKITGNLLANSIVGSSKNDSLYGAAGNDSLYGGNGNDALTGGAGNDVFVYESGNDLITDYTAGQDKIKFNVAISSSSVSGSNVIFKTSNGNVTVQNGKGQKITVIDKNGKETSQIYPSVTPNPTPTLPSGWKYGNTAKTKLTASVASAANVDLNQTYGTSVATVDGSKIAAARTFTGNSKANSIKGGSGADTIYGNAGADILYGGSSNDKIYGGNDNDKLYGDAGNDSLYGNSGNDTLTGGAGNDTFFYENGNDTITDYTAGQDKIKFNVAISSSSVSGSNVIFKTSNGNVTVQNGKDKKITVIDKNGKETSQIYPSVTPDPTPTLPSGWKYGNTAKTKLTASVASAANIDLTQTYGTSVATVDGSKITAARTFTGNSKANSIKGGSGADTIYGNAGADILYGGSGNDKIYGGNDNDKLYGDSGNDSLYGGNGNNTLTGGAGNDVFVYEGGKDVITDYTAGQDKIKISSGKISKTTYSGKDVIFTIGSGTLTVKNSKGKKITVTDSGNKAQTYSKTLDLLYDNNFVANEFALDEISEVTETNYSVGKLEYSNNTNELANNSIISASYYDKK